MTDPKPALLPVEQEDPFCLCCTRRKSEHTRGQCPETAYFVENKAATPAPTCEEPGEKERLTYDHMGSGGRCDWQQLREAVSEATMGYRDFAVSPDADTYPGHVMLASINYNSLDRIVTAFVDAALRPAASAENGLREALQDLLSLYEDDEGCRSLPQFIKARAALNATPLQIAENADGEGGAKPSIYRVIPVKGDLDRHAVFDVVMGDAIAVCPDKHGADIVATALAQPQAGALDLWQPIETAPKDGTSFIGFDAGFEQPDVIYWDETVYGGPAFWAGDYIDHWGDSPTLWAPTHWQPLPAPPLNLIAGRA